MKIAATFLLVMIALSACGGSSNPTSPSPPQSPTTPTPTPTPSIPAGLSPALTSMLQDLPAYIVAARAENQELLPRNPQSTQLLQAKIAMLGNPSLAADIINPAVIQAFAAQVPLPQRSQVADKLARITF